MTQKIRAFIAIEIPRQVMIEVEKVQTALKRYNLNIRWVPPKNIHLTLKFLGNILDSDIKRIHETIEKSVEDFDRFSLYGKGIGVFPGLNRARVVWIGVKGEVDVLRSLQARLENELESLGFTKEDRPFAAHLTLGRVKGRLSRPAFLKAMEELNNFETEPFSVGSIVLFRSDLKPSGAVYSKLVEVPFGKV